MAVRLVRAYLNGYWPLLSALLIVVVAGLKAQQARNPSTRLKPLDHWKPWFCPVTVCLLTSFDSCYKLIQLRDPHRRRHWNIGFWEPVCRRSEGCRCNLSGGIVASLRLSLIERDSRHIGDALQCFPLFAGLADSAAALLILYLWFELLWFVLFNVWVARILQTWNQITIHANLLNIFTVRSGSLTLLSTNLHQLTITHYFEGWSSFLVHSAYSITH